MAQQTALPIQYIRQYAGPIDVDEVFDTTAARNAYLTNPRRYAGQKVSDLQTGSVYMLNAARSSWIPVSGVPAPPSIRTVDVDDIIEETDDTILVDTTDGEVEITYDPTLDTKVRRIKNIGAVGNNVVVIPSSGTIDGAANNTVGDSEVRIIQSDLTNLYLV